MMLFASLFTLFLFSSPKVLVEGLVVAMEEKSVTVKQEQGSLVKIPRASFPPVKGVRVGKDTIHVWVSPAELMKMNPKAFSKKN